MAQTAGDVAYFQRGSLFWFTVITVSFGYYTVSTEAADSALAEGRGRAGANAIHGFAGALGGQGRDERSEL